MSTQTTPNSLTALDPRKLGDLHDEYYPQVYRYLRYRLEDEGLCEDLAAEVFLRLLEHLTATRARSPCLWLLGTARHLVQDTLRGKYRRPTTPLEEHEHLSNGATTELDLENSQDHQRVRAAMQKLTADQQHVLALRFTQELSLEEAARIMQRSVNAIKVLQHRAVDALRRHLEPA